MADTAEVAAYGEHRQANTNIFNQGSDYLQPSLSRSRQDCP